MPNLKHEGPKSFSRKIPDFYFFASLCDIADKIADCIADFGSINTPIVATTTVKALFHFSCHGDFGSTPALHPKVGVPPPPSRKTAIISSA